MGNRSVIGHIFLIAFSVLIRGGSHDVGYTELARNVWTNDVHDIDQHNFAGTGGIKSMGRRSGESSLISFKVTNSQFKDAAADHNQLLVLEIMNRSTLIDDTLGHVEINVEDYLTGVNQEDEMKKFEVTHTSRNLINVGRRYLDGQNAPSCRLSARIWFEVNEDNPSVQTAVTGASEPNIDGHSLDHLKCERLLTVDEHEVACNHIV